MTHDAFTVAPALDVLEGRCVRLREGVRERVTVEGGDPVEAARRFEAEGARLLHVVDLDGAFTGKPTPRLVERIAAAVGVPVQVGGGLRTLAAVEGALEAGAARAIVGTAARPPFPRYRRRRGRRVRLPTLGGGVCAAPPAGRSAYGPGAALEQNHVAPDAVYPADALEDADTAKAAALVERERGVVLREDPGL